MPDTIEQVLNLILVILTGLSTGSFVTALAYRLPRDLPYSTDAQGRAIRSICPPCGRQLRPVELIPVLSWVYQRGRCACGKTKIPVRYPLIELGTLVYTYFIYLVYGFDWQGLPAYILIPYAVAFFVIAAEGNRWNRVIFLSLLANTGLLLLVEWYFLGAGVLTQAVLILPYLLMLWGLQHPDSWKWGRNKFFKIGASALFLLWFLFFPHFVLK